MQVWNLNGELITQNDLPSSLFYRTSRYADALLEPVVIDGGQPLFWEEHYFHLMASMRKLRYGIPMSFTPEYLEGECLKLWEANGSPARFKLLIQVLRNYPSPAWKREGQVHFVIKPVQESELFAPASKREMKETELYKDHYLPAGMLSNLSVPEPAAVAVANAFALENGFDDCALLNEQKQLVRALSGLLFIGNGEVLKTPSLETGAPAWVIRKQLLLAAQKNEWTLDEGAISPFEIPKATEVFTVNAYGEFHCWKKYRKTVFGQEDWLKKLEGGLKEAEKPVVEKED